MTDTVQRVPAQDGSRRPGRSVPDESMAALATLAGLVLAQDDLVSTLNECCRVCVAAVPGTEGASVTTFEQGRAATVASSDDWAKSLDEAQYEEHEGPCVDCWRNGTVFRVRDLSEDVRWPFYGPRAAELGARSSVSLPLTAEGKVVGALNLYARTPGAFDADAVSVAEVIAAHTGMAVQVATAFFGHRDLAVQMREALQSRPAIEQAKGVLMAQRGVDADAAFALLRQQSQARNVKLRTVAEELLASVVRAP